MDTLLQLLKKTETYFEGKGIDRPRLDAELIFAHVLGCKRLDLYLDFERPLPDPVLAKLRPLVARRGRREPLQFILGNTEFFGLTLKTDGRSLIPRPETEELVALLTELPDPRPQSILDLGTGSGAIALALARAFPGCRVCGADKASGALELARENARGNGMDSRVEWMHSDWLRGIDSDMRFDWIVSNPPYLSEEEWAQAAPEVREYEPRAALVSGAAGMDDLMHILKSAVRVLNAGGLLALETGLTHHPALDRAALSLGFARTRSLADLNGRPRFFLARTG